MNEHDWLARQFETNRNHLRAVAYRMLGSASEADDVVQEAWLRLSRSDTDDVDNLGGWLTTVVARICLDALRARKSRREESLDGHAADAFASDTDSSDPEQQAQLADSVGPALLVVLETLAPAERLAFVLHDMFAVPFDRIAPIVGRTPTATRQLASRARRRVQGAATVAETDIGRQRKVVDAFLAASRSGDFAALLAVLDPDVVLRADRVAVEASVANRSRGAPDLATEVHGANTVADTFSGRAQGAQPALVDGMVGAVWAPGGTPRVVIRFAIAGGKVVAIEIVADPSRIGEIGVVMLDA
ncbi:sigma-70 family RNA polymerase sigma factor [Luteimonas lutimaris]|uniref:Sigma-70 family RNA polymerase sigma factor n=1 Tax=Luteimonas lutimaris TaxID=698645 RepID=A0ABP7MTT7_9GAMM